MTGLFMATTNRSQVLDDSSEFLLGESLQTKGPDTPLETQEFLKAFTDAIAGLARRRSAGKLRYVIHLFDRSYERACTKVHSFIDKRVNRALGKTAIDSKPSDLLPADSSHRYVFLNELATEIRDPLDLR